VAKGPTKEKIGQLRWLSIGAVSALFVTDYGFNLFQKEVPTFVYGGLVAIAVGIDMNTVRIMITAALAKALNIDDKKGDDK
jgi:hypothetical protein